jgi:hypothetical protein
MLPELLRALRRWSGLIPPDALDVPSDNELRDMDQSGCAMILDPALRRVSVARNRIDRQMGRRLDRLRRMGAYKRFGTPRLGDYAENRLELGARSAQEMARVAKRLEELPLLRAACDAGTLTFSHLRLLAGAVTPATEAHWLDRARDLTVRELRHALEAEDEDDALEAAAPDSEETEHERIGFEAPARVRAKWRAAVERVRMLEGNRHLPTAAAAECIVAEWVNGPGHGRVDVEGKRRYPEPPAGAAWPSSKLRDAIKKGCEEATGKWAFLPREIGEIALPAELSGLDGELAADPYRLDQELVLLARLRRGLEAMAGRMLLTLGRLRLYRAMEFLGQGHYAEERLGLGPRTARDLRNIEYAIWWLPKLREAWETGEIGIAKMRLLIRVAREETDGFWLERARALTVKLLDAEVKATLEAREKHEAMLRHTNAPHGSLCYGHEPATSDPRARARTGSAG